MIHHLSGCEVYVDQDNNLECCDPEDTLKCEAAHKLSLFAIPKSCFGDERCKCGGGHISSNFREECVQLFRGAPPVKQEAERSESTTEGPSATYNTTGTPFITEIQTITQEDIIVTTNSPQNTEDL